MKIPFKFVAVVLVAFTPIYLALSFLAVIPLPSGMKSISIFSQKLRDFAVTSFGGQTASAARSAKSFTEFQAKSFADYKAKNIGATPNRDIIEEVIWGELSVDAFILNRVKASLVDCRRGVISTFENNGFDVHLKEQKIIFTQGADIRGLASCKASRKDTISDIHIAIALHGNANRKILETLKELCLEFGEENCKPITSRSHHIRLTSAPGT